MIQDFKSIDPHDSVLLVGIGDHPRYLHEVVQPESYEEIREKFGDCEFTDMAEQLHDMDLKDNLYLLNVESKHDFLNIIDILKSYDFSYVAPVGLYYSDYFYDPMRNGQKTYYCQYFLQQQGDVHNSIFIFTDKRAELYEDIDAFLDDMNKKIRDFREYKLSTEHRENLIFVANNLHDVSWANAILAGMISTSDIPDYPTFSLSREAIFDIDYTDNVLDLAYFKTHLNQMTTVENLLNQHETTSPIKIVTIYRICLYIAKELDYQEIIGSFYYSYRKRQVEQVVSDFLGSIRGWLINDFNILDVSAQEDPDHPGTVIMTVKYEIQPVGYKERYLVRTVTL